MYNKNWEEKELLRAIKKTEDRLPYTSRFVTLIGAMAKRQRKLERRLNELESIVEAIDA